MRKPASVLLILLAMMIFAAPHVWAQDIGAAAYSNEKSPTARLSETTLKTPSADKLISGSTPPPVSTISPDMLSAKEAQDVQKRSLFWYRNKQLLINQSSSAFGDIDSERIQQEQSGFRYYFDIAMQLYKEARFEEARNILEYLSQQMPDDKYLAYYLDKLRKEEEPKKASWLDKTKKAMRILRDNEISRLIEEGVKYFEQNNFDTALLKFADVLAIDPGNRTANEYMSKLKNYYSKEVRAEEIAIRLKNEPAGPQINSAPGAVNELLDKHELESSASGENNPAQKLLNDAEFNLLTSEKRAASLMDKTELDSRVRTIISQKQYEERKTSQLTFGTGDILKIIIGDHPELSGEAMVATSGYIFLPVTNEAVYAKDMTLAELTANVTELENKYVRNPVVNIEILDYRSKMFYVIDETSCTPYPITRANLTLMDALFLSDWGDDRALARVLVIKPSQTHPIIKKVNAYDLIFRGKLASNVQIDNGDIIYVPRTIASKAADVLRKSMAPISTLNSSVNTMREIRAQAGDPWANILKTDNGTTTTGTEF